MYLSTRGVEQYYEVMGQGTPLLCLPAFPFTHMMYREQQALAEYARLILPDYRGTGRSSFTDGPYTMELLADDMLGLLDALEIEQAVVLGVSMGGYVAFSLLDRHPERVCGLILADSRADADDAVTAERRQLTVTGLRMQGASVLRERVNALVGASTLAQRAEFVAEIQGLVAAERAAGLAEITRGLALRADRQALLARIHVPALVLCGEEDTMSPPAINRAIAERIAGATFHLLPGAGHLSPWEQPQQFNRYVGEFLVRL